jgi:hypothetical protein
VGLLRGTSKHIKALVEIHLSTSVLVYFLPSMTKVQSRYEV